MKKLYETLNEHNFFKIKLLRNLLIVSLLLATVLPACNIFFIYPSFTKLLIESTEDGAVRTAAHLASMLFSEETELRKDSLTGDFLSQVEEIKSDFELMKLKVFLKSGEIIFSTDPKDIGKINKKPYFHEIVAKGKPYSKFVRKDTESLEDQKVTVNVVEPTSQ